MKNLASFLFIALIATSTSGLSATEFDISANKLFGRKTARGEVLILQGDVRIVHGSTVATADSGVYDKGTETFNLTGRVIVEDHEITIRGDRCTYFKGQGKVVFPTGFQALKADAMVVGETCMYEVNREILHAFGHVFYTEPKRNLEADTVTYYKKEELLEATGNVWIRDEGYPATLGAQKVTYDRKLRIGIATGNPVLRMIAESDDEDLIVTADSMEVYVDEHRAVALENVRITRGKTHGRCHQAVFLDDEDKSILTGEPYLIQGRNSLSGETITIRSEDNEISSVVVAGDAKCIYQSEKGEKSELNGNEIILSFQDGELALMDVTGDAIGNFRPGGVKREKETNQVRGGSIRITFASGEARTATVTGGVTGKYDFGEGSQGETVEYSSDSLYYDVPGERMFLSGNATVVYRRMKLQSESIQYDSRNNNLYATVKPVLWEGETKITGVAMVYNLKTRRGAIIEGRTKYGKGIYTGRVIRKIGENVLDVEDGTYTSCDLRDPHYSFTSSRMKLYSNDKVIAKPVILRVRNLPIFALPFYMFPIKKGRHSGILIPRIEFGFDENRGRFIRNAGYYWAPNDYFDLTVWGDYYEQTRWIAHLETRYNVRYLLNGSFEASYMRDIVLHTTRWDLNGTHTQNVGEEGKLVLRADFVSDSKYRKETSEDLEKALRRVLESSISYSRTWDGKSLSIAAERKQNLDTDYLSEKLPTLNFLLTRRTLIPGSEKGGWHGGTFISASTNLNSMRTRTGGVEKRKQSAKAAITINSNLRLGGKNQLLRSNLVISSERKPAYDWSVGDNNQMKAHGAIDEKVEFIARFNPYGSINVNPSITGSFTVYDEDKEGKKSQTRTMYWASLSSKLTLFRTFHLRVGRLNALRHVVVPSITYTFRPDFSKYSGRFYSIPGISGEVGEASYLRIAISQKVHAKLGMGSSTRKINNLLTFDTSTSYNFLYKKKGLKTPFSTISNTLRVYPSDLVRVDLSFTNDPIDLSFRTLSLTARLTKVGKDGLLPGLSEPEIPAEPKAPEAEGVEVDELPTSRPWRIGVAFRLSKDFELETKGSWLEIDTGFNLTRNWRVDYSGRFDLVEKVTVYQEFSVYRDLHCWEARFVRRYSRGEWQYYFRINIKAHPEIYAERGLRALYRR